MFLWDAKNQNQILKELETEIKTNVTEFKNVKLDFLTIVLYGNFEKDLNKLKENKKILNDEAVVLLGLNTDKAIELSDYQSISSPKTPETLYKTIIKYKQ